MRTFMLGDVVVYPELNRLQVAGRDVHIEPKVMAVLEAFVESPREVVGRQQLLDRVWTGRVVGEEALTRCVSQLRSALGDRATDPTYIQTVPKRGYRLLVTPRPVAQAPQSIAAGKRWPLVRASRWMASAAALLIAGVIALWSVLSVDRPRSIAVLAFDAAALAEGPGLGEYFGGGFAEDLQNALVELPELRVSARQEHSRAEAADDVQVIGQKLGVDVVLTGSVRRLDGRLRISARLVDVDDGHHLWARTFEWDERDLYVLQDAIVASVAHALGIGTGGSLRITRLSTMANA